MKPYLNIDLCVFIMGKMFYVKRDGLLDVCYIHVKKYRLINIIKLLLVGAGIPVLYSFYKGNYWLLTMFVLLMFVQWILWKGSNKVILKKAMDGKVEIFDKDFNGGKVSFYIQYIKNLKIRSKIKEAAVGNLEAKSNTINVAQLQIVLSDGMAISFGSNIYRCQLKKIRKYLNQELRKLDNKIS